MREVLYGRNAVHEALRAGRRTFFRLRIADSIRSNDIIDSVLKLAKSKRIPVQRVTRHDLDRFGKVNHQGVMLDASQYPYTGLSDILASIPEAETPALLLVLDLIQDPQNLGSLLRTAEAVGVQGVIIQQRRAAHITAAVVNASAGAVEYLAIARVNNIAQTIVDLKAAGIWVAGLDQNPGAHTCSATDLTGPLAIVVGSEGRGLRRLVRERCDFLVELPMYGQVTSLNAAVAGSIVLYEALRQRAQLIAHDAPTARH